MMQPKPSRSILLSILLLATAAYGEEASSLFARFKAASGGAHWDAIQSLQSTGTLSAGGLSGEFHGTQDLLTGRSKLTYKVGPIDGAQGYDGTHAWERAPGGEVAALDAPEAVRRARSTAWLDAKAYWYLQRIAASYGKVESRELAGKQYRVIEATPSGGDPVTLWFASDSGLLARTVQSMGSDIVTTLLDDYRSVDGVLLPFHISTDQTDAAGRSDARQHVEFHVDRIDTNVVLSKSDFAMPAMAVTARIADASGMTRIPFDLVDNHIYLEGAVDGKPARFMVDTGGQNLLTPEAAKKFGLKSEGKMSVGGAGKQRPDLAFASAKEVRIGSASLARPVFIVVDLGDLPKVEGVAFDGLVGYEMFRRFGVQIDYAKKLLTLCDPAKFAPPAGATSLTFDLDGQMPIISGVLDDMPVRLTVDTGSRAALTLSEPFVRAHDLVAKYKAAPESVIGWGVGGAARGRPARLGTLRLGNLDIKGIAGTLIIGTKGGFTNPEPGWESWWRRSASLHGGVRLCQQEALPRTAC